MDGSTVIVEGAVPHPSCAAVLVLQRGASTYGSFSFDDRDVGKVVRVGAGASCEWQVAAPGVAPLELMYRGDALCVRSTREERQAHLNGAALSAHWTELARGDVLAMGAARIQVTLAPDSHEAVQVLPAADAPARSEVAMPVEGEERAELRLRGGASRFSSWTFGAADAGVTITLGSAAECDWQIVAAAVEPIELTVLYAGSALLVKSARPGQGARLDGKRVGGDWTFVRDGARIDMGLACLEARVTRAASSDDTSSTGSEPDSTVRAKPAPQRTLIMGSGFEEARVPPSEPLAGSRVASPPAEASERTVRARAQEPARVAAPAPAREQVTRRELAPARLSDPSGASFILGDARDHGAARHARNVWLALALVLAYAAWVLLLDAF